MQIPLDQRNPPQPENSVSKSCNHAISQLRTIFENLRKLLANERKTGKNGFTLMYMLEFNKVFSFTGFLMSI